MLNFTSSLLHVFLCCVSINAFAQGQEDIWSALAKDALSDESPLVGKWLPEQFQTYRLTDAAALHRSLGNAPERFSITTGASPVEIVLPLPDGSTESFYLFHFPVLQPNLAAAYPDLKTYTAVSVRNPAVTAKIEMTPRGLSAMILGRANGTIFIAPYQLEANLYYAYYEKDQLTIEQTFRCELEDLELADQPDFEPNSSPPAGDCQLRQYRLALACTGEYAQFYDDGDDTNGDIVADALAGMVITINRVNGIFEQETGITLVIIDENEEIIFTDPQGDPYTNGEGSTMSNENVPTCTNIIGDANFDIGHVFGTGGGGLASIGAVCGGNKARAASGLSTTLPDAFALRIVTHEMGHQFGARHTQNNDCSRSLSTSYEPGSGSTIMSYAGICPPMVELFPDAYFHAKNLEQIGDYVTGAGNACPIILSDSNTAPVVDAGGDYTIPISTPFLLTAEGMDADGDSITYCWEQWDLEWSPMPPLSTSTEGPAFRSFPPQVDPVRYFPRLPVVLGLDPDIWEVLPSVSRELNFRVVARDNSQAYGCSAEDNMTVTATETAGPFRVTSPSALVSWNSGDTETITWDVANTDSAPVDCANVDILLSTDGGFTYPEVLATSVPNNGSYTFVVPDLNSSQVRIMVRCTDNIFFAVSPGDIGIGFNITCVQLNSVDVPISISAVGTPTITSSLNIDLDQTITALKVVDLTGTHSYVGDLQFKLVAPDGEEVLLIDQRCAALQDFDLSLEDAGQVLSCPYNDGQTATPVEDLATLIGDNTMGEWQLVIADLNSADGGALVSWGLEICYAEAVVATQDQQSESLRIQLMPNPVREYLTVRLVTETSLSGRLQLMNSVGQVLEDTRLEANNRSISHSLAIAALPAGTYYVRFIDSAGGQLLEKFIKQ